MVAVRNLCHFRSFEKTPPLFPPAVLWTVVRDVIKLTCQTAQKTNKMKIAHKLECFTL